jgi:hypothetical protein
LEELDQVFAIPHKTFIKYQTTKAAPHFYRRYVLRQKIADLEPLVELEGTMGSANQARKSANDTQQPA